MNDLGRVLIIPKGAYSASTAYEYLDMVSYGGIGWVAKQNVPAGNTPSTSSAYWMKLTESGVQISNSTAVTQTGIVAMDAVQANPSVAGTMANQIAGLNSNLQDLNPQVHIRDLISGFISTPSKAAPILLNDWHKNFLQNTATTRVVDGITFTVNADKSVTVVGTSTESGIFVVYESDILPFMYEGLTLSGCPQGGSEGGYLLRMYSLTPSGDISWDFSPDVGNGASGKCNAACTRCMVFITIGSGVTMNHTFYPMIRPATDTCTAYVPYEGYEITACGKNLVNIDSITEIATWILCDITNELYIALNSIGYKPNTVYIFQFTLSNGDTSAGWGRFRITHSDGTYVETGYLSNSDTIALGSTPNKTVSDVGFVSYNAAGRITVSKVQVEESIKPTDYEPYQGSTVTVTNDTTSPVTGLQSYDGITNVFNQYGADMSLSIAQNDTGASMLKLIATN